MKVNGIDFASVDKVRTSIHDVANKTDDEIVKDSYKYGNKVANKKLSGKVLNALPAVAVASIATINAVSNPGKLSAKLATGAHTLGAFAFVSVVFDAVHAILNKTEEKIPKVAEKSEKHPLVSTLLKIGASIGATTLAIKGAKFSLGKITKKFPKLVQDCSKMSKTLAENIDNSPINTVAKKIGSKFADFKTKHPKGVNFLKKNSFLITLLSYFGLSVGLSGKVNKTRNEAIVENVKKEVEDRKIARDLLGYPREV